MPDVSRSADRPGVDDVSTTCRTTPASRMSLTRPNVLVIGPVAQTEAAVNAIVAALGKPARFWAPDVALPALADGRAIVIRDVATLSPVLQTAWLAWLFIHIFFLIGFRNRILVMIQWAWSYFTYDRSARLITGADRPVEIPAMEIAEESAEIGSRPDEPSILTSGN